MLDNCKVCLSSNIWNFKAAIHLNYNKSVLLKVVPPLYTSSPLSTLWPSLLHYPYLGVRGLPCGPCRDDDEVEQGSTRSRVGILETFGSVGTGELIGPVISTLDKE